MPSKSTDLMPYPWVVIRFRCDYCERWADARLAACAAKFGRFATLGELDMFVSGCDWAPNNPLRKPQKYGRKCGAFCQDIGRSGPPDYPPFMGGLTVIDGGKGELLPAERSTQSRRRVGGGDE